MSVVLDASAMLAVVFEERGAELVLRRAKGAIGSAVNLDEVLHKSERRGIAASDVERLFERLEVSFLAFGVDQARRSARLKPMVDRLNISFADRACLALGLETGRSILCAETDWDRYDLQSRLGIEIVQIR